jgi:hypothetical protein
MDSVFTSSQWAPDNSELIWVYIRFFANIVIILATVLFFFQLCGYNPAKIINSNKIICTLVCLTIVASILMYIVNRNFYLPFLGWTVYPCGALAEKVPTNADTSILVKVKPNSNVIYWASEPTDANAQPISNPWDAYANYDNSGVVRSDAQGNALLRVRKPSSYRVGFFGRELKRHIHYRVCNQSGMLSATKTVNV